MIAKIYTDGGSRNNPGPSAAGAIIYWEEKTYPYSQYLGERTNNQAEYLALLLGMEKAQKLGIKQAECYLDSKLVVEQVNRNFKIKDVQLGFLFVKVWNLSQKFEKITFSYIPREKNKEADRLVNECLDKQMS